MSKPFYLALALIFAAFSAYEVWLNGHLSRLNTEAMAVLSVCEKPARVPPVPQVFYFQAGTPISRSVMVSQ